MSGGEGVERDREGAHFIMKRRKKTITPKSLFRPLNILMGIPSSAAIIEICVITAGIKKYKSFIKKNKKNKHDKIKLLGKDKLNIINVLISKALIDSYISHDEFVSVKNALKEYNEMKKEIKNSENPLKYTIRLI